MPFYVGKGKNDRAYVHLRRDPALRCDNPRKTAKIKRIREAGYEPVVIFWAKDLLEDEAYRIESELILRFGRYKLDEGGILTNICVDARPPSAVGRQVSSQTKEKIASAQRGERNHRFGMEWSEEQKNARAEFNLSNGIRPPVRMGPMSQETKDKISKANSGKRRSPEICERLSAQRKGRARQSPTQEIKDKIRMGNIGKKRRPRTPEEKLQIAENMRKIWAQRKLDKAQNHKS